MNNLDFGIVGNCRSAALVSKKASIDWCCLPEFDSASVFAKILDNNKGGHFGFLNTDDYQISQSYIKNTCVLKTRFENKKSAFEVLDFLPRYQKSNQKYHSPPEIIRFIRVLYGEPEIVVDYQPRLEYAKGETNIIDKNEFIVGIIEDEEHFDSLFLYTNLEHEKIIQKEPIKLNSDAFFLLSYNEKIDKPDINNMALEYERTKVYWLDWCHKTPNFKHFEKEVLRSAMTLKLLSYDKSGAILAAATTSLPETIGEVRNWDYRFCWIRDASMVVNVISKLNHNRLANRYLQFVIDLIPDKNEKLQIMYGINKEKQLTEHVLDHLSGYENSKPVRTGNAAYQQKQNDIYGILMDVIYQELVKFNCDVENKEELWTITKGIAWVVKHHWTEPDKGIWEFRQGDRHFTFSKVLCWVAIDRA